MQSIIIQYKLIVNITVEYRLEGLPTVARLVWHSDLCSEHANYSYTLYFDTRRVGCCNLIWFHVSWSLTVRCSGSCGHKSAAAHFVELPTAQLRIICIRNGINHRITLLQLNGTIGKISRVNILKE